MTRLFRFSLLSLMISPALAASDIPASRWHLSTPIELTDGEHADALGITDGNIRLRGGSQAGSVRLNNGELKLDKGSSAGSVWIGVGEGRIAGAVAGDVYCGTGTLTITATAEIQGNVTSLGCVLDIAGGARIGGDVVSFGPDVRLGPDLALPGRLAMLPGRGEREERDRPTLDVRRGTAVSGGVLLDHCVQIEVGRDTDVRISGVAPHEPTAPNRPDHAPCSRFPGAQGVIDRAGLPAPDDVFVHGAPESRPGSELSDVRLVNSGMELAAAARAGTIRTHNGAVVLGVGAVAKSLDVLNGAVVLKPESRIEGPVNVGNGPLVMEQGSSIQGEVRVVTSS
ncbi:MAG: polymer-forming cytoskeletal protein, partial [Ahniella sp.]|nr:polymer-forming cytoskeletal protein [Ahniella sp.]